MKKLFLFITALVLNVNVFAQSETTEQIKGDVNGDGIVDVADIAAIISIMKKGQGVAVPNYFYLGTTQPTAENFKTLPGVVATYTSIDEAVGATASVAAGEMLYMFCPTTWLEETNVVLGDQAGKLVDFSDDIDDATISGFVAVFFDTGELLANNMIVTINNNDGDFLFIKVDKRDTVNNFCIYNGPDMPDWEFPLELDAAVIDGDYKYYKTEGRFTEGEVSYKINKTNN